MSESSKIFIKWLEEVIIGLNLCPFAKTPYEKGLISITNSQATTSQQIEESFDNEVSALLNSPPAELSNALLYFSKLSIPFEDFYGVFNDLEDKIESLSDQIQIVIFHPEFKFEGLDENDRANYVNCSPYPMIHILRTEEVSKATESLDGEDISFKNEAILKELSEEELNKYFS